MFLTTGIYTITHPLYTKTDWTLMLTRGDPMTYSNELFQKYSKKDCDGEAVADCWPRLSISRFWRVSSTFSTIKVNSWSRNWTQLLPPVPPRPSTAPSTSTRYWRSAHWILSAVGPHFFIFLKLFSQILTTTFVRSILLAGWLAVIHFSLMITRYIVLRACFECPVNNVLCLMCLYSRLANP